MSKKEKKVQVEITKAATVVTSGLIGAILCLIILCTIGFTRSPAQDALFEKLNTDVISTGVYTFKSYGQRCWLVVRDVIDLECP